MPALSLPGGAYEILTKYELDDIITLVEPIKLISITTKKAGDMFKIIIKSTLLAAVLLSTSAHADFLNQVEGDGLGAAFMGINSGIDSLLGYAPSNPGNTANTFQRLQCFEGRYEFCYQNNNYQPQVYYDPRFMPPRY